MDSGLEVERRHALMPMPAEKMAGGRRAVLRELRRWRELQEPTPRKRLRDQAEGSDRHELAFGGDALVHDRSDGGDVEGTDQLCRIVRSRIHWPHDDVEGVWGTSPVIPFPDDEIEIGEGVAGAGAAE